MELSINISIEFSFDCNDFKNLCLVNALMTRINIGIGQVVFSYKPLYVAFIFHNIANRTVYTFVLWIIERHLIRLTELNSCLST